MWTRRDYMTALAAAGVFGMALDDSINVGGMPDRVGFEELNNADIDGSPSDSALFGVGDGDLRFRSRPPRGMAPSWSTSRTAIPTARSDAAGAFHEGVLYVFGGTDANNGGATLSSVEAYDFQADSWSSKTAMPGGARKGLTAFTIGDKIYVCAGSAALTRVEEYDPVNDSWDTGVTDLTNGRRFPTSGVVDGKGYVIGGTDGSVLDSVEEYDPAADSWTAKTAMPTARSLLAHGDVTHDGKIYAIGGRDSGGNQLATNEAYDASADSWDSSVTDMPTARDTPGAVVVAGRIYVISGQGASGGTPSVVESYDVTADAWRREPSIPTAIETPVSQAYQDEILVVGGHTASPTDIATVQSYTGGSTPVIGYAKASATSNQTGIGTSSRATVALDTQVAEDPEAMAVDTANDQIKAVLGGLYEAEGRINWVGSANWSSGDLIQLRLSMGGTIVATTELPHPGASQNHGMVISGRAFLDPGDAVFMEALHQSGSNEAIQGASTKTYLEAEYKGPR